MERVGKGMGRKGEQGASGKSMRVRSKRERRGGEARFFFVVGQAYLAVAR